MTFLGSRLTASSSFASACSCLARDRVQAAEHRVDGEEVWIELERLRERTLGEVDFLPCQVDLAAQFLKPSRAWNESDLSLDAVQGDIRPLLREGDTHELRRRVDEFRTQGKGRFELLFRPLLPSLRPEVLRRRDKAPAGPFGNVATILR